MLPSWSGAGVAPGKRMDWTMRGFRQFDAPVSVIGCIDRDLEDTTEAYFDLGQFIYGQRNASLT